MGRDKNNGDSLGTFKQGLGRIDKIFVSLNSSTVEHKWFV